VITGNDTDDGRYMVLSKRLERDEFSKPILEKYADGQTFIGIYDLTRKFGQRVSPHFCERVAAFFESVARSLPRSKPEDDSHDVYPQFENRTRVASHLRRERSRLLATERKILDGYQCQVCRLVFGEFYGKLGAKFAEAHHLVPLARLRENVKTRVEDLVTVCANCHRMLHRMAGERTDIGKLRTIVRRSQRI
jgi:5-methylcytosine-specific restriction endonuclease McrA